MLVLGIETSCDETGLALYDSEDGLLADELFSQIEIHKDYGGVVPELASRDHADRVLPLLQNLLKTSGKSLNDIDLIAYTAGPGLKGCLLVGSTFARSLAYITDTPIISVNHIEAHLLAPFMEYPKLSFPFFGLLISGLSEVEKSLITMHSNLYFSIFWITKSISFNNFIRDSQSL